MVKIINQINNTNDEDVSFLRCKIQSKDITRIISKNIIEVFLLMSAALRRTNVVLKIDGWRVIFHSKKKTKN